MSSSIAGDVTPERQLSERGPVITDSTAISNARRERTKSTSTTGSGHGSELSITQVQYSYKDLANPNVGHVVRDHNSSMLKLLLTVADFAQKVATAHQQFSVVLHNIVKQFEQIGADLKKERSVDFRSTIHTAWDTLLHETEMDAQAQADTADLLIKNVYNPLVEVAQHKKNHAKKLYSFREQFENELDKAQESLEQTHQDYIDSFERYRSNSRDTTKNLASYFNAHNDYILQLWASNCMNEEYITTALPFILEELEEIHIDTSNVLNGAIESHSLLLVTKANEQSHRYEEILKVCNVVNPKDDITNFIQAFCPDPVEYLPEYHQFTPPETVPGTEVITKSSIIVDRLTENNLKSRRSELQKEAAELTSYIKQNQDVTQTLMNICQRNLANHLYSKVYETQEDLCRKRNEIRMATMQLAAIRAQIELLSPKENGNVETDRESKKDQRATIKGMWKKAFKSLKKNQKEKQTTDQVTDKYSGAKVRRKSFLKRRDSKEAPQEEVTVEPEEIDPVYSLLKCAADLPKGQGKHHSISGPSPKQSVHRRSDLGLTNLAASATSESLNVKSQTSSRSSSPSSVHSISPHRRKKKLNIRMKSFSLDNPETPRQLLAIDEDNSKKKPTSATTSSPTFRRRRYSSKRASSLEVSSHALAEDKLNPLRHNYHHRSPNQSPKNLSPKSQKRHIPSNLYVALYHFKGREKDDLDFRPGWRVSATDTSDPDWWRGQCNGKIGFFPASYVQKLRQGDRVLIVTSGVQLSDGENGTKLLRDQIVIQTGPEEQGIIPIRSRGRSFRCPRKYLAEV
ncbi:uncharacterized protein LOC141913058 [Tubulanus polymorphus]|uniref:uncharacterized protein LOC141913058 n=1 Tax=Tubulanus polymorphus TaxID=672921 RepID=UPI003DA66432